MTKQTPHLRPAPESDLQIVQMRRLLTEMEELLKLLPATATDDTPSDLPNEEEVEASFDNMPV